MNIAFSNTLAKAGALSLATCIFSGTGSNSRAAEFTVTPEPALKMSYPSIPGNRYQLYSSPDLTTWSARSEIRRSDSSNDMFVVTTQGEPSRFFKVLEHGPDLSQYIVGLNEISLKTASILFDESAIRVSGVRVNSRDFTFDDYLTLTYSFDPKTQGLVPSNLVAYKNLGIVTTPGIRFFIKDSPGALTLTNGAAVLNENIVHSITTTGQVFTVTLKAGQVFGFTTYNNSDELNLTAFNARGAIRQQYVVPQLSNFYHSSIEAFEDGIYSFRLAPRNSTSATFNIKFKNCNAQNLTVLRAGDLLSAQISELHNDYRKFAIDLQLGSTLRLNGPGSGASLDIFDSSGSRRDGRSGSGDLVFTAAKTERYYIVFYQTQFSSASYSSPARVSQ